MAIRRALPAPRALTDGHAPPAAASGPCQLSPFFFLFSFFFKQIVFLIMFLYRPKLLIRHLEDFLLGPECNKLLCLQAHTWLLFCKHRLLLQKPHLLTITGWRSPLRGGGPDLGKEVSDVQAGWGLRLPPGPWPGHRGGKRGGGRWEPDEVTRRLQ